MRVEPLGHEALDAYLDHMQRQVTQSGRDGLPIFNPFPRDYRPDMHQFFLARDKPMQFDLETPGWRRAWAAWDGDVAVGGCELSGGRIATEMHRALFTIGVERSHHRLGLATQLARSAIDWATAAPQLAWIDLGVFSHNSAAIALYEKLGFERTGLVADRFRVDGESIADIQMSLRLG